MWGFFNGIDISVEGSRGGICLAWRGSVSITLRSSSIKHVDVEVEDSDDEKSWHFIEFYGSLFAHSKEDSWDLLRILGQNHDLPWLVSGDFNEIMYAYEKMWGLPRDEKQMKAFREVLRECQLMDLRYSSVWFTWERGNLPEANIRERLERGLACANWLSLNEF